ncbi:Clan ME, family M16, insulinase-like metallopeptidase [Trichomonas vaginalis G3]|uniref:Clan ME, family M16, insulinase-like metallopeptidase n=1 Tax=Trichomonas vaginalis (strain ATCC PRA-98 / G3) TaxID=412133 RepID=A2F1Z2_TRIV3|nr:presequence protease family [Trichomonas vaginalis G3]EAY01090.1 Clan ME, family M16, insulinase-like metallopeptidase [Trichomonas vaginalis G3]KAI5545909.1 presequence protease family [Trichomonas vaginalis G3]|eukprot:XP_001330106.1 Clan ME, family M16, insulinase-like metallopeptidase [Trichomonas vaginalis G3]
MEKVTEYITKTTLYVVPLLVSIAFIYLKPNEGVNIHNFVFVKKQYFPQYNAEVMLYKHKLHGCPYIYVKTSDKHNFFATTLRTTCIDNTGSTHVLEHLTLHGSKKYPIPSVFTELIKSSLASFMNAFTSVEWTAYPFSTTNYKDFHNLLDVYLDSVFNPKLEEIDFLSECHHLEFEQPDNSSSALRHSGVVYNEMNGAMSSTSHYFTDLLRQKLYPHSLFHFNYGGNPPDIANLTFKDIQDQHDRYYNPSNALFFHYGSFNTAEVMKKLDSIIQKFEPKNITIPEEKIKEPRWEQPVTIEEDGPSDDDSNSSRVSLAWLVGDLRNISDVFDLKILNLLLSSTVVSPLYQGLIKTGYGKSFTETGYMDYIKYPYFTIGLAGVSKDDAKQFNNKVITILNKIYKEGFDPDHQRSILHALELSQREISSSIGMDIWNNLVSSWIHDTDPFRIIDIRREFERVKKTLQIQPRYFELLLKTKIIENSHCLFLIMNSDPKFLEKKQNQTKIEMEKIKQKMSEKEKSDIVKLAAEIRARIDAPKPLHLLPTVTVNDINKTANLEEYEKDGNIYKFRRTMNGIVKVRVQGDLPLNHELIKDVPLYTTVLSSLGCDDMDENEFQKNVTLFTGGIHVNLNVINKLNDDKTHGVITLSSYCLDRDAPKMIELMSKMIFKPHFNNTKMIETMLKTSSIMFNDNIINNGHRYAAMFSSAALSRSNSLSEIWFGVSQQKNLKYVLQNLTELNLQKIHDEIIMKANFSASIHGGYQGINRSFDFVKDFVDELNKNDKKLNSEKDFIEEFSLKMKEKKKTIISVDSQTYFCCVAMKGPSYNKDFEENNKRTITITLLKNQFLWDLVREKLGAYGAIATHDRWTGTTVLASYRDTNPVEILGAFKKAVDEVLEGNITDEMIGKAKITTFGALDQPEAPADSGLNIFQRNMDFETEQKVRNQLLSVTKEDIIEQARKMKQEDWTYCVVGSPSVSEKLTDFIVYEL